MPKLLKILLSSLMLWLVVRLVDSKGLSDVLSQISIGSVLLVVAGYAVGQSIASFKWWLIARAAEIPATFPAALRASFIGAFVNSFGLGLVGGDLTRAILLSEKKGAKTPALASVIADRAHGLAVLALIGMIAAVVTQGATLDPQVKTLLIVLVPAIVSGWWIGPYLLLKIVPRSNRFRPKVERIAEAFPQTPLTLAKITTVSVIFHLTQISLNYVIVRALGIDLSFTTLLIYVPVVNILATLPLTWNGLGVRETSYLYFLGPVLTAPQSIAMGAIWLLAVTTTSAIGGIVSVLTKEFRLVAEAEVDAEAALAKSKAAQ